MEGVAPLREGQRIAEFLLHLSSTKAASGMQPQSNMNNVICPQVTAPCLIAAALHCPRQHGLFSACKSHVVRVKGGGEHMTYSRIRDDSQDPETTIVNMDPETTIVNMVHTCCRSNPTGGGHGASHRRRRRRWRGSRCPQTPGRGRGPGCSGRTPGCRG
jgi:hypothetical protein